MAETFQPAKKQLDLPPMSIQLRNRCGMSIAMCVFRPQLPNQRLQQPQALPARLPNPTNNACDDSRGRNIRMN
jgi:hypothetical protein